MNKLVRIVLILLVMLVAIVIVGLVDFKINISPVSSESTEVQFEVNEKVTYYTLGKELYEKNLIKSEFWYKVYIKLTKPTKLEVGKYILNKNMSVKDIINLLSGGSTKNDNAVNITFKEGVNIRKIAKLISEKTNNSYEDVLNTVSDQSYLNELINTYWFLTSDILNSKIYYPLEGYLFPETYQVLKTNTVKEIFKVMLDQTDRVLTKYKSYIDASSYSIHQLVTLASIVELEAGNADDRAGVAGVFYNRLTAGWALGSDVTTYYGSKIDDFSYSLTSKEVNDCTNSYNTRCSYLSGLPIGPIASPGEESFKSTFIPEKHNYYYFVADCSGKTYLNYSSSGHESTISTLKANNNWCA